MNKGSFLNLPRIDSTYYGGNVVHFSWTLKSNYPPAFIKSRQSLGGLKRKIKYHGNIDEDVWYANNQLFCNLYTVYVGVYLLIYLIIKKFFWILLANASICINCILRSNAIKCSKRPVSAEFLKIHPKLHENCAVQQNFYTRKLG